MTPGHPTLAPTDIGRPLSRLVNALHVVARLVAAALSWRLVRYEIAEDSMAPALRPGDWVVGVRRPRRKTVDEGSVVVADHPRRPGFRLVKRVVAPPPGLPDGQLWLLGDNPAAGSVDSRALGPFPFDRVHALVVLRYHPRPLTPIGPPPPGQRATR